MGPVTEKEGRAEAEVQPGGEAGGVRWRGRHAEASSFSFVFFPVSRSFSLFCLAVWGEGDQGALLGSIVSIWDGIWLKAEKKHRSCFGQWRGHMWWDSTPQDQLLLDKPQAHI